MKAWFSKHIANILWIAVAGFFIYCIAYDIWGHKTPNYEYNTPDFSDNEENEEGNSSSQSESICGLEDDSYNASVDYYNPETGHMATYELEVDVVDCQVIQINFPKGGWLDESHIYAVELDEDGNASVEDDKGRSYDVHIYK